MRKNLSKKRNYAFIDSQNLNLGIRDQGWRLDFAKFRIFLKDKYKVFKAFLFIGYIKENKDLYDYLKKSGYVLVFKPILKIKRGKRVEVKGNVDAELVLHTMIEYENFDKAIIISGDGDFHCLIEYLRKKNKLGRVIVPNIKKYSRLLWEFQKFLDFMNGLKYKLGKEGK